MLICVGRQTRLVDKKQWPPRRKDTSLSELNFNELVNQDSIDAARKRGEARLSRLSDEDLGTLRRQAKTDLFFLCRGVLGYEQLSPNLHGHLCRWLERTAWEQFRLLLMPRSHFKTTISTIGESIQLSLPSKDLEKLPYPANLGTDIRLLLAHESHAGAQRFLYEIMSHFTGNPLLMALFPECVPSPRVQRMNNYELELPRSGHWAEPTFDTIGQGGRGQGRHYNRIKLDDIFGDKMRDSKTERDSCIQWFDNIQSFLIWLSRDGIDLTGTRYSLDDVYAHAIATYGPKIIKYIRRIEEYNPKTKQVEPIFPEKFTPESLTILRKNPKVWAAQYVNDPHEGLAEFDQKWKRYFHFVGRDRVAAFFGTTTLPTTYHVRDLDRCILVDPSVTGTPGIVVTATDDRQRVFCLETIKRIMKPAEFVEELFKLVMKWNPRIVSIESVVFSAVYRPWVEREMRMRNIRFNIYDYKPPKHQLKNERVKGLGQYFSAGQILFHEGLTDLIWEYDNFGATQDYHILDALAQGPEVWRAGGQQKWMEKVHELEQEVMNDRDMMTGYSSI